MPDPDAAAVREIVTGLLAVPEARRAVASEISGIGLTYPGVSGAPPTSRPHPTAAPCWSARRFPAGWADRVETRAGAEPQLVRPDGYVVWSGGPGLEDALHRWLGQPATAALLA